MIDRSLFLNDINAIRYEMPHFITKEKNITKNERYGDQFCEHKVIPIYWTLSKEYVDGYIKLHSDWCTTCKIFFKGHN